MVWILNVTFFHQSFQHRIDNKSVPQQVVSRIICRSTFPRSTALTMTRNCIVSDKNASDLIHSSVAAGHSKGRRQLFKTSVSEPRWRGWRGIKHLLKLHHLHHHHHQTRHEIQSLLVAFVLPKHLPSIGALVHAANKQISVSDDCWCNPYYKSRHV